MMLSELEQFHFSRFTFHITFMQEGKVPEYKTSAIRGGMGQTLLDMYCFKDYKNSNGYNDRCNSCIAKDRCIVQNIMYSKFKIKPDYVTEGESAGFTLYCPNKKKYV
ncbi:MAG: hypothetical protein K6G26_04770, partial [Lachnospiraceae bacterium]|nr:hypothetical protein [Lachnospiraceae bacterium]